MKTATPLYLYDLCCISAQNTYPGPDFSIIRSPEQGILKSLEPAYDSIPPAILRRMGKAVRMGAGAALRLLSKTSGTGGIIIGTSNGGMEDCIRFLNQITEYQEGRLTPTNFVQSTLNAVASHIGFLDHNHAYNMTHVHRGLAFENALMDTFMLSHEYPGQIFLLGGLDEISSYNYNIELLSGAYKQPVEDGNLYESTTPGSIAGEGVAMFLAGSSKEKAIACVKAVRTIHTNDPARISGELQQFLQENEMDGKDLFLLISGENGDQRLKPYYEAVEQQISSETGILRYKHCFGDFPTVSALSLWLACLVTKDGRLPDHFYKKSPQGVSTGNILLYNTYKGEQHSFILAEPLPGD